MKIEIKNNGIKDCVTITADEGKTLKRKNFNEILGNEIWLGTTYYIDGLLQNPPHIDAIEDFEEIDEIEEPNDSETV